MKKFILSLLFCIVPLSLKADTDFLKKMEDVIFDKQVVIKDGIALERLLADLSTNTKISFCLEAVRGKDPDVVPKLAPRDGTPVLVKSVITELLKSGYKFEKYGNAVLVSTPSQVDVKANPLDAKTENFDFKGSHADFVNKISVSFPDSRASGMDYNGGLQLALYLKINGSASLRDVLMEAANKNGMIWYASIAPEEKESEVKGSDGIIHHFKLSRLRIFYGRVE